MLHTSQERPKAHLRNSATCTWIYCYKTSCHIKFHAPLTEAANSHFANVLVPEVLSEPSLSILNSVIELKHSNAKNEAHKNLRKARTKFYKKTLPAIRTHNGC